MTNFDRTIIVRDNQGREASLGEIIDAAVKEERERILNWLPEIAFIELFDDKPSTMKEAVRHGEKGAISQIRAMLEHPNLPPTEGEGNKK
jgi:hypothetical protein